MENTIPHLTYQQFRTVQRLVHQCCNNVEGNCLLLDDGWEPCACVQSRFVQNFYWEIIRKYREIAGF